MNNERTEQRIATYETGTATILGHPDVSVACHIRDFAQSGMCIIVDQAIDCGKIVKVEWENHFLVGRVQRVDAAGGRIRVGLELLHCSKWSEPIARQLA